MPIKIAFFDCDGTLTKIKSSWEYIHRRLNIWDNHADEYQRLFHLGLIDYDEFCKRDALLWKGKRLNDLVDILNEIPYQEGAPETVSALKKMDIYTVILSTGLSIAVERVRDELGIDMSVSNDLVVKDGLFTGETRINVCYNKKGYWVNRILKEMGEDTLSACAIGDGEGDADMFSAVNLSILYKPYDHISLPVSHTIHNGPLTKILDVIRGYNKNHEN